MKPLLRLQGVTLRRGGRVLFEQLNLELARGEALLVRGPNGSGKSSLLRLAAGLLEADAGCVERPASALADDNIGLDRELPLRRALQFWVRSPHQAMEALGLIELEQAPVRLLSSGQLKRATLARVAASGSPLWLLDEPLNALDARSVDQLSALVTSHLAGGGGVLAASHQELPGKWGTLELSR